MENKYIVALLRAAINNTTPNNPPDNIDWKKIYTISAANSIAGTICPAIMRLPKECQPDKDTINLFSRSEMIAVCIDSMQEYELTSVMNSFEENHIVYTPLKGWFMKKLYPFPYMRTMCDVDILVNKSDLPIISNILKEHDFQYESHTNNHDGYIKSDKISVEMHWNLFPEDVPYHDYFSDIMSKLIDADDKAYMKKLSKEDYYLHLIAHLAKHFDRSGTGIRSLVDIWLYNKKYRDTLDMNYLNLGLTELGLSEFESTIYKAATQLFSGDIWDDTTLAITNYVMTSGTYGTKDTYIVSALNKKGGNKLSYLINRIFPDKTFMEMHFPILAKCPVLLPACWLARLFKCFFFRSTTVRNELSTLKNATSDGTLDENAKIKKMCGLN